MLTIRPSRGHDMPCIPASRAAAEASTELGDVGGLSAATGGREDALDPRARPLLPRQHFLDLNLLSPPAVHIGSYGGQLLHWGFIRATPWRNYLHTHSFFEVCYSFQGRGTFRIAGTDNALRAGDVFVARPGEAHEIVADDEDPLGIYFWSYTLVPQQDQRPESRSADALLGAFLTSGKAVSSRTRGMQRTLDMLTEEITYREPGCAEVVGGLVVKLLLDTARAVVDVPALPGLLDLPARSTDEALVQTMVHYLRDNHGRAICLRDVAAQVHMSERHCNRLFHAATGMSIMRFLTTLRLDIAAQLLLEQQLTIKEVAHRSGYSDVQHFMTRFRQRTGMTPTRFRQTGGTRHIPQAVATAT
jgi:AraC-like DNA-binding protein